VLLAFPFAVLCVRACQHLPPGLRVAQTYVEIFSEPDTGSCTSCAGASEAFESHGREAATDAFASSSARSGRTADMPSGCI
jgi:hypothetical protein